jgi:RimJ/RimL family protein N-acetyltransferase
MTIEPIIGRKVILFKMEVSDLGHFVKLHREDRLGYMQRYSLKEMTEEEARKYMAINLLGGQILVFLVMTKEGKVSRKAGYVYFSDMTKNACAINGIMDREFAKGLSKVLRKDKYTYAEDSLRTATNWVFSMFDDMERVEINVVEDNHAALRLSEKCGFKKEGILRHYLKNSSKYHDVVVLSMLREEYKNVK